MKYLIVDKATDMHYIPCPPNPRRRIVDLCLKREHVSAPHKERGTESAAVKGYEKAAAVEE